MAPGRPPSAVLGTVPPTRRGHGNGMPPAGPRGPPACGFGGTARFASEFVNTISSDWSHRLRNHTTRSCCFVSATRVRHCTVLFWVVVLCRQPATVQVSLGNHFAGL